MQIVQYSTSTGLVQYKYRCSTVSTVSTVEQTTNKQPMLGQLLGVRHAILVQAPEGISVGHATMALPEAMSPRLTLGDIGEIADTSCRQLY